MPLVRIHVNQHVIKKNRKEGLSLPPLTVKRGRLNTRAHDVMIHGPSRLIYSPLKPLACGATVWIETEARVSARTATASEVTRVERELLDRRGKV